jgi:hypothetical protein
MLIWNKFFQFIYVIRMLSSFIGQQSWNIFGNSEQSTIVHY